MPADDPTCEPPEAERQAGPAEDPVPPAPDGRAVVEPTGPAALDPPPPAGAVTGGSSVGSAIPSGGGSPLLQGVPGAAPATGTGAGEVVRTPSAEPAWSAPPPVPSPYASPPPSDPPPHPLPGRTALGHAPPPARGPGSGARFAAVPPRRVHRWGVGAYVLVQAVFLLTSLFVAVFVLGDEPTAGDLAVALGVPTTVAAALALLITFVRGGGPRADLGLRWSWNDIGIGLAFGVGGLFLTLPAAAIWASVVGPGASSAVGEIFGDLRTGPGLAVLVFVLVVFVAPLCEEIIYRGLLWGGVEKLVPRPWIVAVVTTLVFAIAHLELTRTPLLLIVTIPVALARLHTGNLLAGIVAHVVNNLLPGVVLLLGLLGQFDGLPGAVPGA